MNDNMCRMEMNHPASSDMTCPGINNHDDNIQNVKQFPCCGTKTVDLSIKDQFLNNRSDSPQFVHLLSVISLANFIVVPEGLDNSTYSNIDISPPPRYGNNLYLNFSLLLI